jgi:hypothetical protein
MHTFYLSFYPYISFLPQGPQGGNLIAWAARLSSLHFIYAAYLYHTITAFIVYRVYPSLPLPT